MPRNIAIDGHSHSQELAVNNEEQNKPEFSESPRESGTQGRHDPSLQYLQREITRLLLQNETMRFELFTVRKMIACVEKTVFAPLACDLRERLPTYVLHDLRALCRCRRFLPEHSAEAPTSDNLINFNDNRKLPVGARRISLQGAHPEDGRLDNSTAQDIRP